MARKKLCLVDAHNQIHRAYHALPELTSSAGVPTNATLGFTTMLRRLLNDEAPDYCAVVFDPPGKTVRHEEYADYKSSRPGMPDDLREQMPWIRRVVDALNLTSLELADYEADDVIGTLAAKADEAGLHTIIVSEDKDLLQLVGDHVHLLSERNERRVYDPAAVEDRYGVPPGRITDLLGLMGDSVDDIPGVPGIGPKRARELLEAYGTLEGAVDHAEELTRYKYGRNLAEYAEQAHLSKRLATVHTGLEVDLDLGSLQVREPDRAECREIFTELEFKRLLDDYAEPPQSAAGSYTTVTSSEELDAVLAAAAASGTLAISLQTDRAEPMRAQIIGMGLASSAGDAVYVPLGHAGLGAANAMRAEECVERLAKTLADADIRLIGHDVKPDLIVLDRYGLRDAAPHMDTMLASYVLHPTRQSHALGPLALDLLNLSATEYKDVFPDRKTSIADLPVEEATRWGAERADLALRVGQALEPDLTAQAELGELYRKLELPLLHVLVRMERRGVRIDSDYLGKLGQEFGTEIDRLQGLVFEAAGRPFNLNSPKQLGEVLFDELGLPAGGKTAKGSRSTKAEVLERLAAEHEIVRHILEYRELSKLKSTYLDALPGYVNPETGRVHASFEQAVAATGRLSSANPNLQNIPVRTSTGRQIRRAFIPDDGFVLMTADYSQIELRIMAHLSGDPSLRRAFLDDFDIHRATAAEIFHIDPDEVTHEQRDRAKVINFGVLYGMGPQRLAREFGVSLKEAKAFIERYMAAYPRVSEYLEETVERAREVGFVTTMLGRVRHLPELQSGRPMTRAFGERIAVNTPLQGTAADLIKLAMVNLDRRLKELGAAAGIIIQVHDELVLEVQEDRVEEITALVRAEMEGAIDLDVPLVVDIGTGPSWVDAKG